MMKIEKPKRKDEIHRKLLNSSKCWTKDENGEDVISFDGQAEVIDEYITKITKTLEVKCEALSDMICARDCYIEELRTKTKG